MLISRDHVTEAGLECRPAPSWCQAGLPLGPRGHGSGLSREPTACGCTASVSARPRRPRLSAKATVHQLCVTSAGIESTLSKTLSEPLQAR